MKEFIITSIYAVATLIFSYLLGKNSVIKQVKEQELKNTKEILDDVKKDRSRKPLSPDSRARLRERISRGK